MQNALVCGIIAALSFIGFVCILYFLMLYFYRSKGTGTYVIKIPPNCERGEIESLLYGAYFKKMIFGDLIFDNIEIDKSDLSDSENKLVETLIGEMEIYINLKPKDSSEENDERQS